MYATYGKRTDRGIGRRLPPNGVPDGNAWAWRIGFGLSVPLIGLMLRINESDSVVFVFLPNHPLPTLCLLRRHFGLECLGCGLTRSIVLLMQGRLYESMVAHSLGWLILLLILVQVPYGLQLRIRRQRAWCPAERTTVLFWVCLFGLLVVGRLGSS